MTVEEVSDDYWGDYDLLEQDLRLHGRKKLRIFKEYTGK